DRPRGVDHVADDGQRAGRARLSLGPRHGQLPRRLRDVDAPDRRRGLHGRGRHGGGEPVSLDATASLADMTTDELAALPMEELRARMEDAAVRVMATDRAILSMGVSEIAARYR